MLDEDKIRLMTRLSVYEEKTGKEDLKMNGYYHADYVALKVRKTVISVTIAYIIILIMVGFYYAEELLAQLVGMDYKALGMKILTVYLIILAIYIVVVVFATHMQSRAARKRVGVYHKNLRHLKRYYKRMEEDE